MTERVMCLRSNQVIWRSVIYLTILAVWTLSAWLVQAGETATIPVFVADFADMSQWKISRSGGSTLEVRPDSDDPGAVELTFNSLAPAGSVGITAINSIINVKPDFITYTLSGDLGGNLHTIHLVDASGENHRFRAGIAKKMENLVIKLPFDFSSRDSWGGDSNKQIDLPIRSVAFQIRSFASHGKCEPQGKIRLSNFRIESSESAQKALDSAVAPNKRKILVAVPEGEAPRPVSIDRKTCQVLGGEIKDDNDLSAQLDARFDDQFLYLRAIVKDDRVETRYDGAHIYQNDGLEFWFDTLRNSETSLNQSDDVQVVVTPDTKNSGGPAFRVYRNSRDAYISAAGRVEAERTEDGYKIELRLSLDSLEGFRNADNAIGFNVTLCDLDDPLFRRLVWNSGDLNPFNFGLLTFGELPLETLTRLEIEHASRLAALKPAPTTGESNAYTGEPRFLETRQLATGDIPVYGLFELGVKLLAEYDNPFDFEQVALGGEFTDPDGVIRQIDGFFYQPHRLGYYGRTGERVTAYGDPEWRLRFTPNRPGLWRYRLTLRDSKGRESVTEAGTFTAVAATSPGFLRVSPRDPQYLAFDNGDSFYGLGFASHTWSANNIVMYTRDSLNILKAFGGNYTSVNFETIGDGGFSLDHGTLGRYSQVNAARFDFVLEMAAKRGVYIIPCLIQTPFGMSRHWSRNRFNIDNGGPCASPMEFYTHPEAQRLIMNRLRYMLARWGYSPNILGWEIHNESNYTDAYQRAPETLFKFLHNVAIFLKNVDPNKHLVSTCFGSSVEAENPDIWNLPEIDFTIIHSYSNDIAGTLAERLALKLPFNKPCLGGENGMPASVAAQAYFLDPKGIAFHNNLWASLVGKGAGNVLPWWDNGYHKALDLHPVHFPPFVEFVKNVALDREGLNPRSVVARLAVETSVGTPADVRVFPCDERWRGDQNLPHTLRSDGIWKLLSAAEARGDTAYDADNDRRARTDALPGILRPPEQGTESVLTLSLECDDTVVAKLKLRSVGVAGTTLALSINDKNLPDRVVTDRDGLDNPYAHELTDILELPLVTGENQLKIVNRGPGFVSFAALEIPGFPDAGTADDVRVNLLQGERLALGWVQNRLSTWYQDSLDIPTGTIRGASFTLDSLTDGLWRLEWWDTWKGGIVGNVQLETKDRQVEVAIPSFERDIAFRLRREN